MRPEGQMQYNKVNLYAGHQY